MNFVYVWAFFLLAFMVFFIGELATGSLFWMMFALFWVLFSLYRLNKAAQRA